MKISNTYLTILSMLCLVGMTVLWRMEVVHNQTQAQRADETFESKKALYNEVLETLEAHFDGEVDRRKLLDGGLKGIADSLKDRYTEVRAPQEAIRAAEEHRGEYFGVGIFIRRRPNGEIGVLGVFPDSPSEKAGVQPGDLITHVDGKALLGAPLDAPEKWIKGPKGSSVVLTIQRGDQTLQLAAVRDVVAQRSVQGTRILAGTKIGYLRIESFAEITPQQFLDAVAELDAQGMQGLILDLRDNGGGSLDASIRIADAFIAEGGKPVVSIKASSEAKQARLQSDATLSHDHTAGAVYKTSDTIAHVKVPVVALINENSASASEVLVGCLQDYGLAFLIGEDSYGKGVVQRSFEMKSDPRYSLKVTIAAYVTPLGNRLSRNQSGHSSGIRPDVRYVMTNAEEAQMRRRFSLQTMHLTDMSVDLASEEDREALNAKDPHIEAALAYFRGEPIYVPLK